jgi:hypothetical protein
VTVANTSFSRSNHTIATATATCASGQKVLGGGGWMDVGVNTGDNGQSTMIANYPDTTSSWTVSYWNGSALTAGDVLKVYAICAA